MLTRDQLIQKLSEAFPQGKFVDASEFYGKPNAGIWIKGDFDVDNIPALDYDEAYGYYVNYAVPSLNKIITEAGWFIEPHDPGTFMIYN